MANKLTGRIQMSNDTRILYNVLETGFVKEKKDAISYAELTASIGGRDVQQEAYGLLNTARRNLNREHGILTETVTNEGLRQTTDVAAYLAETKASIARRARRKSKDALCALQINGLTNEQRVQACTELSLLGAIVSLTTPKARAQIEGKVKTEMPKELSTTEVMQAQLPQFTKQ